MREGGRGEGEGGRGGKGGHGEKGMGNARQQWGPQYLCLVSLNLLTFAFIQTVTLDLHDWQDTST